MTHELNIEKNPTYNFWKVSCPAGDYITNFKDGDDIKEYYGGKELYIPIIVSEEDIRAKYRCVTESEHEAYESAKEEAYRKEEEERRKEFEAKTPIK